MKPSVLLAPVALALATLSSLGATPVAPSTAKGDIAFKSAKAGATPFISNARFTGTSLAQVASVTFTVAAQPGARARPVRVQYSIAALQARGDAPAGGPLTLPVFGLYHGVTNRVGVTFTMRDGTRQVLTVSIKAAAWADPNKVYDRPVKLTPRTDAFLGFDYLYLKSGLGSPVVIDTDGAVRWVGSAVDSAFSSTYDNGVFMLGSHRDRGVQLMQLDGTLRNVVVDDPAIEWFNHNIVQGRDAYLAGVDRLVDGVDNVQSTIAELTMDGHVIREWDFARLIGDYMAANGDDPTQFVHPGLNWLHINSAYYDASDDSLVVSSREQFVMKVDYDTGAIRWILGDPTKWWYQFPSLRAKAITLRPGDFYPVGQHGINLEPNGTILLFDNGAPSYALPPGEPIGVSRTFSVASAYAVDPVTMTGAEVYRYTHAKTLKSNVCSSVYAADGPSMIVDYAAADDGAHSHLVALDAAGAVAFEYQYDNRNCGTAWNVVPIAFDDLTIQ